MHGNIDNETVPVPMQYVSVCVLWMRHALPNEKARTNEKYTHIKKKIIDKRDETLKKRN